jgi:hypothetical protein
MSGRDGTDYGGSTGFGGTERDGSILRDLVAIRRVGRVGGSGQDGWDGSTGDKPQLYIIFNKSFISKTMHFILIVKNLFSFYVEFEILLHFLLFCRL